MPERLKLITIGNKLNLYNTNAMALWRFLSLFKRRDFNVAGPALPNSMGNWGESPD